MQATAFDITADLHTPVSAYLRLAPLGPRYLLETVESGLQGRYSFIGLGAAEHVAVFPDAVTLNGEPVGGGVLDGLRVALATASSAGQAEQLTTPFGGGLVGAAGFDLARSLYGRPRRGTSNEEIASYMITPSILVFDHLTRRIALINQSESERAELRGLITELLAGPTPPPSPTGAYQSPVPSIHRAEFVDDVRVAQKHITAGDVYQLVLSIQFTGETTLDPFTVYRALRVLNPSPYMFFLDFGDHQVVGSSPEALARLQGATAEIWPIAGTRPRGADAIEDSALEQELLADPKEAAEHVMLVDLARNDLGRVARAGTVRVGPFRTIERYSHVMHMVSGVTADLDGGLDCFDLFAAAFPAGTVVGAPKLAAIDLIDRLEPVPRGLYSGSVGWFGSNGGMDQAITIRTAVFRDGTYSFQAGAGIVADSDPQKEHQEVISKAAAIRAAMTMAGEGL